MSQSSTIAFVLILGFIVFVTMKGELLSYAGVLGIGPKAKKSTYATGSLTDNPTVQNPLIWKR